MRNLGNPLALLLLALCVPLPAAGVSAEEIAVAAPSLSEGGHWTVLELPAEAWPALPGGWDGRTFWDLRPAAREMRVVRWTVLSPEDAGLGSLAASVGADRAICGAQPDTERAAGCRLFRVADAGPAGPRLLWSDVPGDLAGSHVARGNDEQVKLAVGSSFGETVISADGSRTVVTGKAVAEGVVLVPAGPRQVVLLREEIDGPDGARLRYRFLTRSGLTAARLEGPLPVAGGPFLPDTGDLLLSTIAAFDDQIEVKYTELSAALQPRKTGFLQYTSTRGTCSLTTSQFCGLDADCPAGETCSSLTLSDLDPTWLTVEDMVSVDQPSATYQPDPGDPSSQETLGEVWDFTGLEVANMTYRTFNTTRDETGGAACPSGCSLRNQNPSPPDGTWQEYLKIDGYDPGGVFHTRDVFYLNDNDTGANPAIDLPFVSQDELNTSDWTQICSEASAGGANRLIHFFQFTGTTTANAVLKLNDTWTSGSWTECDSGNGLHLTAASYCDPVCFPDCPGALFGGAPKGRGRRAGNAGLESTIVEDGWVKVPAGNYLPALLMQQITDIEAGLDFLFGTCNLGTQRNYTIDYFWIQEDYGLLATVSAPTDGTATMPPDDWSLLGNVTDGADFTFGPFPPYQTEALACLSGTQVRWALPADGSNIDGEPGVSDYGYVVSWGSSTDAETLADWDANPNRTPKPGETGYLAAPAGSEPTSYVIDSWLDSSINVTVTTALRYTDPDLGDTLPYRSAALYKVAEDPARLDGGTFRVGKAVAPFVSKNGNDLELDWPAVAGAESYLLRVWDLDTDTEITCPSGMDCSPTSPMTTHPGGAADGIDYGYSAFAVDPCGETSPD